MVGGLADGFSGSIIQHFGFQRGEIPYLGLQFNRQFPYNTVENTHHLTFHQLSERFNQPGLRELRERTESAGQTLVERLPVHADYLSRPEFLDPKIRAAALRLADDDGYAAPRQEAA